MQMFDLESGDHDDWKLRTLLRKGSQFLEKIPAIETGHHEIEQNSLKVSRLQKLECHARFLSVYSVVTLTCDDLFEKLCFLELIFYDQDSGLALHKAHFSLPRRNPQNATRLGVDEALGPALESRLMKMLKFGLGVFTAALALFTDSVFGASRAARESDDDAPLVVPERRLDVYFRGDLGLALTQNAASRGPFIFAFGTGVNFDQKISAGLGAVSMPGIATGHFDRVERPVLVGLEGAYHLGARLPSWWLGLRVGFVTYDSQANASIGARVIYQRILPRNLTATVELSPSINRFTSGGNAWLLLFGIKFEKDVFGD